MTRWARMAMFLLGLWIALAPAVVHASSLDANEAIVASEAGSAHCGDCADAEDDGDACASLCIAALQFALPGERSELAAFSGDGNRSISLPVLEGRSPSPEAGPPRRIAPRA